MLLCMEINNFPYLLNSFKNAIISVTAYKIFFSKWPLFCNIFKNIWKGYWIHLILRYTQNLLYTLTLNVSSNGNFSDSYCPLYIYRLLFQNKINPLTSVVYYSFSLSMVHSIFNIVIHFSTHLSFYNILMVILCFINYFLALMAEANIFMKAGNPCFYGFLWGPDLQVYYGFRF